MTENGDPDAHKEQGAIAQELSERLHSYAEADALAKDKMLPDLVQFVIANFTIDVAAELVDPEMQTALDSSVEKTLQTSLENPLTNNEVEAPWKGGHSIVILGADGALLAARFVQSEQLKEYGDTTPYALTKALCEAYLDDAGMSGGLDNLDNMRHIVRDRGTGKAKVNFYEHIFTGSEAGSVTLGDKKVYLAASGSVAKDEYIRDLLQLPETSTLGNETLAGIIDSAFSSIVRYHLENPNATTSSLPEPRGLQETRIRN